MEFDRRLIQRLERLYSTRDVLRRRELVRAALGARSGDRILDVGCGPGFYITELLEAVGREGAVVGVDISADMLAVAAKRAAGHGNVEFHEAGATSLPVPDASFERRSAFRSWSMSATYRRRSQRCAECFARVAGCWCGTSIGPPCPGTRSIGS
jgi:SAM-dependent methyltransferase